VRSATLRKQTVSLLNDISMGFGPKSMGADSGAWRRAVRSPRYFRNFVCPKIVMTTMSLRLSAGARSEEVFTQLGAIRGCRWRWRGANLLLCG
jgi:hypothetical protein